MTLEETVMALLDALELVPEPAAKDEKIGVALARLPAGHPALEIITRTVKCTECGGLMPLSRINWAKDDDGHLDACCPYCSGSDLVMWKEAVAGHG